MHTPAIPSRRIGFVSTRFSTTDGVSLETQKWAHVLNGLGHQMFYFAGLCNRPPQVSYVVSEAHFDHPEIREIGSIAYQLRVRPFNVTRRIRELQWHLKQHLYKFVQQFNIELLIVENALSIPMNIPLGLALTELIAETGLPTIGHHHDFSWERKRFLINCVGDYLDMSFPPRLPTIKHVVINSLAANQIARRKGVASSVIPNVMDFDNPPPPPDEYTASLRADLGIAPDENFFLQPTRVVRRKGIEHAIELIKRVGGKSRLVISHESGDEGNEYKEHIRTFAELFNVNVIFSSDIIGDTRGTTSDGRKIYSLEDVYPYCDVVTYPSIMEGFGNAFLEAIYFRKPLVVNNYTIYSTDIHPKGFKAIEFEGFITDDTVRQVQTVLNNPDQTRAMTEHNYSLAKKFFSYRALQQQLEALIGSFFGEGYGE
ncbi:MAG TPA: glycosyltransferase family 4 protein [Anaerolineales bacterium]|nr:glycosyltransferase family 4 protein [Anaerolineales bacterium]